MVHEGTLADERFEFSLSENAVRRLRSLTATHESEWRSTVSPMLQERPRIAAWSPRSATASVTPSLLLCCEPC